ncbi:MAG: hypothetical protein J1E58_02770 [Prevotella sp.]|nr:hypothetical protein [Prevotella sp.]
MKKFIYSVLTVFALGCAFTACSDDEDEVINYSTTAEQASAGTYSGTWTRTSSTATETYSGTVTLAAAGTVGTTNVTFSCPGTALESTSIANVWNAGRGFQFTNNVTTDNPANGLGAAFAGMITEAGELTTSFTISIREGRVLTEYQYSFVGNK